MVECGFHIQELSPVATSNSTHAFSGRWANNMPRCVLAILFAAFCAGCSQTSTNSPVRLTPAMFNGYEFTLI